MCGIWAIFGSEEDAIKHCTACQTIACRGPDAFRMENINNYQNCYLGFHRLAIMDCQNGMQPMRFQKFPHLYLCYNGEIYNHKLNQKVFGFNYETECDGESILHLYNKGGMEFAAQHLDGVFGFCLLDLEAKKVFIGRDTYGVRPLFKILTEDGILATCSEAKGLQNLIESKEEKRIYPLKPGTFETYNLLSTGKVKHCETKAFHTVGAKPAYKTMISSYEDDVYKNIRNIFTEAVRKRMMAERRIRCLLSGGLDSSLVAALVAKFAKEMGSEYPIQTFSTGMEGSPDIIAARKVADQIGSEHHEVIFKPEDATNILRNVIYHLETYDTTTVRSSIPMYILSKYISSKTDTIVIFCGEGSDEVCQGYIYFKKAPNAHEADLESRRLLDDLYLFDNMRVDRITSGHGLEGRVPFLDHEFVSYILSLPAELRTPTEESVEKYLLRKAFDSENLIPDEVLWRPKEAFSDGCCSENKTLSSVLKSHAEHKISNAQLKDAPKRFPYNTPATKEAYLYRQIFEELFPSQGQLTPYYWMPKWIDATDPSARTLSNYKSTVIEIPA